MCDKQEPRLHVIGPAEDPQRWSPSTSSVMYLISFAAQVQSGGLPLGGIILYAPVYDAFVREVIGEVGEQPILAGLLFGGLAVHRGS